VAPKDGSAFGIFHETLGLEPLIEPQGLRYDDGRKFVWLGSMAKQTFVCFTWAATGLKTIDDLRSREVIMGGVGAAGAASVYPRVMNALLGTKLREIPGYGGSDVMVAIERGEVEGRCGFGLDSIKATRGDWLRDRKINIVVQFSLTRNPEIADVPTMMELVADPDDRKVLQLMFATQEMGRPFAAPPEIPVARADELKRGFQAAIADPQLLADAKKQNLEISPITGRDIDALLGELYATPKAIAERVNAFRRPDTKADK
jgi:tripartite-type tricarboxylate transporter receptor subunit TctC